MRGQGLVGAVHGSGYARLQRSSQVREQHVTVGGEQDISRRNIAVHDRARPLGVIDVSVSGDQPLTGLDRDPARDAGLQPLTGSLLEQLGERGVDPGQGHVRPPRVAADLVHAAQVPVAQLSPQPSLALEALPRPLAVQLVLAHHLQRHALREAQLARARHRPDPARSPRAERCEQQKRTDALTWCQQVAGTRQDDSQAE